MVASAMSGHESGTSSDEPGLAATLTEARERMVTQQIASRTVTDERVLAAMRRVPRHVFVPERARSMAYDDRPLPIGHGQTISQPYIVAAMTELAALDKDSRVLEIGTGCGYQTAVLAELAAEVYSIEIVEPLGQQAASTLSELGYDNVHLRIGDGYPGWPEAAPFDAVVVTAAPPTVPKPLAAQLAEGGRMVVPVGETFQQLRVLGRTKQRLSDTNVFAVRFVPMVGRAQRGE